MLLSGVVAFTLLIACANLATLLLATGIARAREFGVRLALGAGRLRLVRQLVTESTVLALLGAAVSLLVASWTGDLLRSFRAGGGIPFNAVVRDPGLGTVGLALALALATSILIGLIPALVVTSRDPAASLGTRHRSETTGQSRVRGWLMGVQLALAASSAGAFGMRSGSISASTWTGWRLSDSISGSNDTIRRAPVRSTPTWWAGPRHRQAFSARRWRLVSRCAPRAHGRRRGFRVLAAPATWVSRATTSSGPGTSRR
jgi:hypothetical protein